MEDKIRFFIISYLYGNDSLGSGTAGYKSEYYPNYKNICSQVKQTGITILNIMEVSEKNYNDFWR